jgi:hypothetical protein
MPVREGQLPVTDRDGFVAMTRRAQASILSIGPLVFATLVLVVLAGLNIVAWSVVIAVGSATLLLVVVSYWRLGRRRPSEGAEIQAHGALRSGGRFRRSLTDEGELP